MQGLKKSLVTGAFAVVMAAGTMAAMTTIASADVACNGYGECWNTHERYAVTIYPPDLGVQFYDNDWRASHQADPKYHWMKDRDDDHGYYSHEEWHSFKK